MKYLKHYENFFSNLFKKPTRKADGKYFWTGDEQIELESLGFINSLPASSLGTYYYIPTMSDNIKKISIIKNAEILHQQEDFFYDVILDFKDNKKQLIKDFDNIQDVIIFVKQYIPEIETDTKKYNL